MSHMVGPLITGARKELGLRSISIVYSGITVFCHDAWASDWSARRKRVAGLLVARRTRQECSARQRLASDAGDQQ